MASVSARTYDPLNTDEQAPWMPESGNQAGREVRLLGGVLTRSIDSRPDLKRRLTSIAGLMAFLLFLFPVVRALVQPLYSETCHSDESMTVHHQFGHDLLTRKLSSQALFLSQPSTLSPSRRGHLLEVDERELGDQADSAKALRQEDGLQQVNCTMEERSTLTLWCALILVILLKFSTVGSAAELVGGSDAAKREGWGGVFFRLVGIWNFWGPVCILAATLAHFEKQFSDGFLDTVHNTTSGEYYIVEHPANLTNPDLVADCKAFGSFAEMRSFGRWALGAGGVMTFTLGSLFFGIGEMFKIDPNKAYCLHLDFVGLFHSCWQGDELLDGYDALIYKFQDWSEKHSNDIATVHRTLQGLEDGAMQAIAGPAAHFEKLGKQRMISSSRWCLEPLFVQKAGLKWEETLLVLSQVSVSRLLELGPEEWFNETWESSMPLLKTIALGKARVVPKVQEWTLSNHLEWDEIVPIIDAAFDLDSLNDIVQDPEQFLQQVTEMGPIAKKIAIGRLLHVEALTNLLMQKDVEVEDAVHAFGKVSLAELQGWAEKVETPEDAESFLTVLANLQGPVSIAWALATLRARIAPSLRQMDVRWDDALHVLGRVDSVQELRDAPLDFEPLKKKFDLSWKIAGARQRIEPELQRHGLEWPLMRETLEKFGADEDVKAASTDPKQFLENLDQWKKKKEEDAEKKESQKTAAAVNTMEQTKMIWPALFQCTATALWLMTTFVNTSPCVMYNQEAPLFFGVFTLDSGFSYIELLVDAELVMLGLLGLLLAGLVAAMKFKVKPIEKRAPLIMACFMGAYTVLLSHMALKKRKLSLINPGSVVRSVESIPIGTAMSVGFVSEAAGRVTAAKISTPSEKEQTAYEDRRNKLIEQKAQELVQAAPAELKKEVTRAASKVQEVRREVVPKANREEEQRRQREAEQEFLRQQELAAEEARKKEEEERQREAEREAAIMREAEIARLQRLEQERKAEAEALERTRKFEEALALGQAVDLDLPFMKGNALPQDPERWHEALDSVANAINDLEKHSDESGSPPLVLSISTSTIGGPELPGINGLLQRRAKYVQTYLKKRGVSEENLQIGEPKYRDSAARVIIRAVKIAPGGDDAAEIAETPGSSSVAVPKADRKLTKEERSRERQKM